MQNELSYKTGKHLILVILTLLDVHDVFNLRLQRLILSLIEFCGQELLAVDKIIDYVFQLL